MELNKDSIYLEPAWTAGVRSAASTMIVWRAPDLEPIWLGDLRGYEIHIIFFHTAVLS